MRKDINISTDSFNVVSPSERILIQENNAFSVKKCMFHTHTHTQILKTSW